MSEPSREWIRLNSGELSAEIDPLGAQLSVLRDRDGRDLLWNGDPAIWAGRAPLLFPIVGALAGGHYRLAAKSYALPRHGFARGSRFEVLDSTPTHAVFQLTADSKTLAVYPFHFELTVRFDLQGATLSIVSSIRNVDAVEMPASFGYHPAFRWPLPYGRTRSEHFIEFAQEEPGPVRRLDAQGLLTPERHPTPIVQRRLPLDDVLFEPDVIILDAVESRSVSFGADTGPRIRISFAGSPYLGLWSKPGAPFVCIEPWRGVADPVGFSGDFKTKPGVFLVTPGSTVAIEMSISLLES